MVKGISIIEDGDRLQVRGTSPGNKLPVLPPIPTIDSVHVSPARRREREQREKVISSLCLKKNCLKVDTGSNLLIGMLYHETEQFNLCLSHCEVIKLFIAVCYIYYPRSNRVVDAKFRANSAPTIHPVR